MNTKVIILFATSLLAMSNHGVAATSLGCLIEPDQVANVGSQVIGVTEAIMVERGDFVRKGQVLATLKADIERASVSVARTRSQLEADIRTAEANLQLAKVTEQRGQSLVEKKFLSQQALDKSHAETVVAQQRLAYAREQLTVAGGELSVAKAQLGMRAIRSPIDGIVSDRYVWQGERVEEKPLFRIVKINPLRVEVIVPVALYGKIAQGDIMTISPDLPNAQAIDAKIVLVDKIIDGASNTFRIRAEIPNEDMKIPSGVRCKATLPESFKSVALVDQLPSAAALPNASPLPTPHKTMLQAQQQSDKAILNAQLSTKNKLGQAEKTVDVKFGANQYAQPRTSDQWNAAQIAPNFVTPQPTASKPVAQARFVRVGATLQSTKNKQEATGKIKTVPKPMASITQTVQEPSATKAATASPHVVKTTPIATGAVSTDAELIGTAATDFKSGLTLDKKLDKKLEKKLTLDKKASTDKKPSVAHKQSTSAALIPRSVARNPSHQYY